MEGVFVGLVNGERGGRRRKGGRDGRVVKRREGMKKAEGREVR